MALINKEISSLVGGVSRQPPENRSESMVENATNTLFDPSAGATKRPPFEYLGSCDTVNATDVKFVHTYDRDDTEQYNIVIQTESGANKVRVYNAKTGFEYNTTTSGSYLGTGSNFKALTLGDTTIITNQDVTTQMSTTPTAPYPLKAIFSLNTVPTASDGSGAPAVLWLKGFNSTSQVWTIPINVADLAWFSTSDSGNVYGSSTVQTKTNASRISNFFATMADLLNMIALGPNADTQRPVSTGDVFWFLNPNSSKAINSYNRDSVNNANYNQYNLSAGNETPNTGTFPTNGTILGDPWYTAAEVGVDYGVRRSGWATNVYATAWVWNYNAGKSFMTAQYGYTADGFAFDGIPRLLNGEKNPHRDEIFEMDLGSDGVVFTTESGPPITKLPAECEHDFITKMRGDDDTSVADEYYLRYDQSSKAWVEDRSGDDYHDFDLTTMPHVLNRVEDALSPGGIKFEFGPADSGTTKWASRMVGDTKNAPPPSFIGEKITGLTYFKGRLGLLNRNSTVLSETSEPFNFWPTTVMTLVDSDPIDVEVALGEGTVVNLFAANATEAGLILYDRNSQHLLRAEQGQPFTPRTASIDTISRYPVESNVNPTYVGDKIYWPTNSGNSSNFWEFNLDKTGGAAINITAHVEKYLPKDIDNVVGSQNSSVVIAWSSNTPTDLYVYNYLFGDQKRIQAAWSKWILSGNVVHTYFIDHKLYCLIERNGNTLIERLDIQNPPLNIGFQICLDSRLAISSSVSTGIWYYYFNSSTNQTVFAPGSAYSSVTGRYTLHSKVLVAGENTTYPGKIFTTTDFGVRGVSVHGNLIPNGNEVFYAGESYDQAIELSRFVLSRQGTQYAGPKTYTDGRTQLKTLSVSFSEAGPFTIEHKIGDDTYTSKHSPVVLEDSMTGSQVSSHGIFFTDVGGRNTETISTFKNNSPIPTTITGLRWEAQYHSRGAARGRF